MDDYATLAAWHRDEKAWWDMHGEYMTYQWTLTSPLNDIVRSPWIKDFTNFLFCENGALLDMGCGVGWLSLDFAKKGMSVLGIDISDEQIKMAKNMKNKSVLENLNFECTDIVLWDCTEYRERFDSIFMNAFLHHLPPNEIEIIFQKVSYVLKKGGKCYLYEPLTTHVREKSIIIKLIDYIVKRSMSFLIIRIPHYFNLLTTRHRDELRRGYVMQSPHEAPVYIELIKKFLPASMSTLEIRGWHLYSLGFCMQLMSLNESFRGLLTPFARLLYRLDRMLLKHLRWEIFAREDRFLMCSMKLVKI